VRGSLRTSFWDGLFAATMLGVTEHYMVPLALFLGATVWQIGWVSALPNLLGSLSQFFSVQAVRRLGGRLRLLVSAVFFQATFLALIAFLALFPVPFRVEMLIAALVLFAVSGAVSGPAWGSLMSDYLPPRRRGEYFGWRNRILGSVSLVSMVASGLFLYLAGTTHRTLAFFIVFLVGSLARYVSAVFLSRMGDVPHKENPASDFSFYMFIARFRESNFVKFVAFVASLTFASYIASPYFAVFMLQDLHLSYFQYMAIQVTPSMASLATFSWWGRHADLVGNARVLKFSASFTPLIPLLWLPYHNVYYLLVLQILSGFAWSGVNLCATNFIYDAVTPAKRVRCIAYFNLITGVALSAGAWLGGYLATALPPLWGYRILSLFALSAVLRFASCLFLSGHFREIRPSQQVSSQELFFSVVGIRPLIGGNREWLIKPVRHGD